MEGLEKEQFVMPDVIRHPDHNAHDFLRDPDNIASPKYHFFVAIEAFIDLSNHIISRNGHRSFTFLNPFNSFNP